MRSIAHQKAVFRCSFERDEIIQPAHEMIGTNDVRSWKLRLQWLTGLSRLTQWPVSPYQPVSRYLACFALPGPILLPPNFFA
jgi:hypothetical protein